MPRLQMNDIKQQTSSLKGVITKYMDLRGVDEDYMAMKLNISKKAFRYKLDDPGKFYFKEVCKICNLLQIPNNINIRTGEGVASSEVFEKIMQQIAISMRTAV